MYFSIESREEKVAISLALVYYANSILSVYLAIMYSQVWYYSLVFWTLFCLDQLYYLIKILPQKSCSLAVSWLLDLFHLSPILMFFSANILEDTLSRTQTRLHSRVLPQLLSQTILIFGIRFRGRYEISDTTIVLAYINFLILISLAVFLFPQVRNPEGEKSIKLEMWISFFAVYIVLAQLFTFQDSNGVRLGFYCLGIQLIPLLILVYQYPRPAENWRMQVTNHKSYFIYLSIFQIPIKELLGAERVQEQRNCCLLCAVNSAIKFFLFMYGTLNNKRGLSENILLINLTLGVIFAFATAKCSVLILFNIFVNSKVINLKFKDKKGYQKQLERIPQKKRFLSAILIDYMYGDFQFYRYSQCLQKSCDFQCELSLQLYEKLDKLQRQNVEIVYHQIPTVCEDHAYALMESVQYFPERVLEMFPNSSLTLFGEGGLGQLNDIMMKRYSKGFFCGNKENKINDILKETFQSFQIQLNPRERKNIFAQLISNTLQTFVFLKIMKRRFPLLCSTILIDLYERDDQNVLLSMNDSIFDF